jgi:truncated hemoglobin YjbI
MSDKKPSLFDELGGEARLRGIIDVFVDRLFDDMMVGFMFARVDRDRLKQLEYEFAAQHLGGHVAYSGRSLESAHRAHRIFDGQFARRLKLLSNVLEEAGVPESVRKHWIEHTLAQRDRIIIGACNDDYSDPGPR